MNTVPAEDGDKSPLLGTPEGSSCSRSYGSLSEEATRRSSEGSSADALKETERSDSSTPATGQVRDAYHRRLLVFNVLAFLLGIVTSTVLFLELYHAYGQCIIGMDLYQGGLLTRGVKRFWCRCPLYTMMLTTTIPWVAIMINWVSDLFTKKCAFGKWLKWQAILTCSGAAASLAAAIMSAWGFGNWCRRVIDSLNDDDMYTATISSARRECYNAATIFDTRFPSEFVKLKHTFWFTLAIMILQLLLLICWVGSCYFSVGMWKRLPKDTFFAQMLLPPDITPRGRLSRRENNEQPIPSNSAIADQTVNHLEDDHLHSS